ncbi:MAG: alpha/beta hydrolase [Cyclobacteriaceae bacterium]|nr:alpha/beta hydrolase [Cyclobacteriaceae bacterium]
MAQRKGEGPYFKVADIPYAKLAKEPRLNALDVYMPKKGSKSPVIIWVHGGLWAFGDKSDVGIKPTLFTEKGYIFISINHRLSPDIKHPGHMQDVAHALVWVYNNIVHYSGDPEKIFLMGYASGAQMSVMITVNQKYLDEAKGSLDMIKGVISIDGLGFDVAKIVPDNNNKVKDWCLDTFGLTEREWQEASPVTHIKPGIKVPPIFLAYSGVQTPTESDALNLARKFKDSGVSIQVKSYAKKNSLSIHREFGKEGDPVGQDVLVFLQDCLRKL